MEGIQKFSQGNQIFSKIYDSKTGVLNKAIHQLSGRYKIIVSSRKNDYKLYLADYTGYKIELDVTKDFMSQVSEFLKTPTTIDERKTLYGGYSDQRAYSWHIPMYISSADSNLPEFFLVFKTDNKQSSEIYPESLPKLFKYSSPIDVIDLDKVYITNIFKTIQELKSQEMYLDCPVQLYWSGDDKLASIILHGFDYDKGCVTKKEINIKEYVQNRINKTKEEAVDVDGLPDTTFRNIEKIARKFKNTANNTAVEDGRINANGVVTSSRTAQNQYVSISTASHQSGGIAPSSEPSDVFDIDERVESVPEENISEYDDFGFFNNLILELFEDNHLIFPRFINIEFEFDYERPADYVCDFQNFFGYFANITEDNSELSKQLKIYRHKPNTVPIEFNEIDPLNPASYTISQRKELVNVLHVQDIKEQDYMAIIKPSRITTNDRILIISDDEEIINFYIERENIKETRYKTMINIGNRIQYLTNDYITVETTQDLEWRFKCCSDFHLEFFTANHPSRNYAIIQESENINLNDVQLIDTGDLENLPSDLTINDEEYTIMRRFVYDGHQILRLNQNPQLRYLTEAKVYDWFSEEMYFFYPIPFLNKFNDIQTRELFNAALYAQEIQDVVPVYVSTVPSPYQYKKPEQVLIDNNSECVFVSGNTNFVNIHTLNYDDIFGRKNGCLEKYPSYFLIKGQCPDYLMYDFRSYRYFEEEPKLRSTLKRINANTCECVFLGTKFSTDIKYEGYKLCVYLDIKAEADHEDEYYCIIDHVKKHIDIVLNKPLEFTGINAIDLSIFKNINIYFVFSEAHNEVFSQTGFKFCDAISDQDLMLSGYNSRIMHDKFLVLRNRMYQDSFTEMYEEGTDILGHYYALLPTDEADDIVGLVFTIKFINPSQIQANSFLCDDIELRIMYTVLEDWEPTDIYHQYDDSGYYETYEQFRITVDNSRKLHRKYIHELPDFPEPIMLRRYLREITSPVDREMATQVISLKSQYFHFRYKPTGEKVLNTFPQFYDQSLANDQNQFEQLINPHYNGSSYDQEFTSILENSNNNYEITLFDTNKIWQIVAIMCNDMTSPHMTLHQLQTYLTTFNFEFFVNWLNGNLLHVFGTDDSIKINVIDMDVNMDRDNKKMWRYSTFYKNYFTEYQNMLQFQNIRYSNKLMLFTIFNKNYGYYLDETYQESLRYDVGATGIWGEVHNLVSSLFTGDDLSIKVPFKQELSVAKELIGKLYYDKMIINNENNRYLKNQSINVRQYIKEIYPKYILDNFYDVESVFVDGSKVDFEYNKYDYTLRLHAEQGTEITINLART